MKKILLILATLMMFSAGCGSASNAVDNVKKDAAAQVQEAAGDIKETAGKIEQQAAHVVSDFNIQNVDKKFFIGGICPGMQFEEVKRILGEPTSQHDDDEFTFANGLVVEISKHKNIVEDAKVYQEGVVTGAGISVGMTEQNLIDAYGRADSVDNDHDKVEYKYYSADRRVKIEFEIRGGIISEIKTKLND